MGFPLLLPALISCLNGMYRWRKSLLVCFRCLVKLVKSANVFPVMSCRVFPQTYPMWKVQIGFYIWVGCKFGGLRNFRAAVALSGSRACRSFLYRLSPGEPPGGRGAASPLGGVDGASIAARRAGEKRRTGGGTPPAPWGSSRRVAPFIPPFLPAGEMGGWFFCVKDLKS